MPGPGTGIDELDAVLVELTATAQAVLGPDLVGVYLQGSFALGGVDGESDCDFLVITAAPVGDGALATLGELHRDLPHRPGYWNQHLEGSYAPAVDLADVDAVGRPWPYVNHGSDEVILDPHCNTEVTRWILHEHGLTLVGPSPRTLLGEIPAAAMRSAARARIGEAVVAWERHTPWDAWSQRYAVITMARMLRTSLVGDVVSKPAAVAWAADALDRSWRPLLVTALAERGTRPWDAPVAPELVHRTVDFVRYAGRSAQSVTV